MKMSQACYDSLKSDIQTVCDKVGVAPIKAVFAISPVKTMFDLLAVVSFNRAFDDAHPHFAVNNSQRFLPHHGRDYCWYYKDAGGLHDSHVETALLRIGRELFGI